MKTLADKFLEEFKVEEPAPAETPVVEAEAAEDDEDGDGKVSNFETMYHKIHAKIEKQPMQKRPELLKKYMKHILDQVQDLPMADRKLLNISREFWKSGFLPSKK